MDNGWLKIIEENPLVTSPEVLHHRVNGRGCCVVCSIDVAAIHNHRDVVFQTLLVDNISHIIDRGEDKASVRGYHQVLGADRCL